MADGLDERWPELGFSADTRGTWPAQPEQLAHIRASVRAWLTPLGFSPGSICDIVLAVNEAASNSIEHAYRATCPDPVLTITYQIEHSVVCIEVIDTGRWRGPRLARTSYRGHGIPLMNRLVDHVDIRDNGSGTTVLLRHPLPGRLSGNGGTAP